MSVVVKRYLIVPEKQQGFNRGCRSTGRGQKDAWSMGAQPSKLQHRFLHIFEKVDLKLMTYFFELNGFKEILVIILLLDFFGIFNIFIIRVFFFNPFTPGRAIWPNSIH